MILEKMNKERLNDLNKSYRGIKICLFVSNTFLELAVGSGGIK